MSEKKHRGNKPEKLDLPEVPKNVQGKRNLKNSQIPFRIQLQRMRADFPIINFNFEKVGVYWIEIILNNTSHLSIPLSVHQLQS